MTTRRQFCFRCAVSLLFFTPWAGAQRRLWRIGYHSGGSAESNAGWLDAFRKGMAELGWSEARQYVIDARYADGDSAAERRLAAELVATEPDVILTTAEGSILALASVTKTIPVVFALGADPVGNGYASSLQRPGGNATGLSAFTPELSAKRLQLLKEAFPRTSHVVALYEPLDPAAAPQVKTYEAAAAQARVQLSLVEMRQVSDIDAAFKQGAGPAPDAYVIVAGRMMNIHRKAIAERVLRARALSISSNVIWAEAGLLMTYAPSYAANFHRAANYVDKILKGAKPGELAIEQPTKFDLVINARTAKALGLTLPSSLRLRAERVIE
jgi:putative tryptophan/tyrosine transport system substrate-binding protein